jgi:chemotaxis protein methyltransferase CheR
MDKQAELNSILPQNYQLLRESIYAHVGIVLEGDKHYLFEGRLNPIAKQLGFGSINDLCGVLPAGQRSELGRMIAEAMTTNETYFFREPPHYELIRSTLLPTLLKQRRECRKLRFWSAASSTGQEAYSLAMLLYEEGLQDWDVEILGTDFSSKVVDRAATGLYQQIEVNRGLPLNLLVKHFSRTGMNWQLNEKVRRMARFETIDLRQSMRDLGPFDLVFCRNVMIYFDAETKRKIMKEIHGTLCRGGWLLLGGAESAFDMDEWYERQRIGNTTVYVAR